MNSDLKLIREFGDALNPPTDEAPAALRHRVMTTAAAPTRRSRWVGFVLAAGSLRARVLAGGATALMAAAALVAALTQPGADGEGPKPPDSGQTYAAQAPARVLELASARAAVAPMSTPKADQFLFTEWIEVVQEFHQDGREVVARVGEPTLVRQWRSVDGSREGLTQRRAWRGAGAAWRSTPVPPCRTGNCPLSTGFAEALPTDGDAMYYYLHRTSGRYWIVEPSTIDAHVPALRRAAEVLRLGALSPQVQAAVFDAVGRITGVRVRPGAVDVAGRSGTALVLDGPGGRTELVFDASTYQYLGMNQALGAAWLPLPKTAGEWTAADLTVQQAIVRVAVVDRVAELP